MVFFQVVFWSKDFFSAINFLHLAKSDGLRSYPFRFNFRVSPHLLIIETGPPRD